MSRLIDADAAFGILADYYHHRMPIQYMALKEALDRVPTVEAVPVIRCKDCKYWDDFLDKGYCKDTIGFDRWWKPNDFCSYAERRTDG